MCTTRLLLLFILLCAPLAFPPAWAAATANQVDPGESRGPAVPAHPSVELDGGLTTLYALDPLAGTMNFSDGAHGGIIQDHMVRNRQSDIDFSGYTPGSFSVGIEGGRHGAIVDLGAGQDLARRYGYQETVSGGQGYASIRVVDGHLHVLADYDGQTTQPLKEADQLVPSDVSGTAPVRLGHIYLVRLVDRHDPEFGLLAKFLVVSHRPGESVTLRWQRLR